MTTCRASCSTGSRGRSPSTANRTTGAMPGFASSLTDDQISQILTYVRSSWGNNASAVAASVVAAERAKPGTPADNYKNYPK